MLNSLGFITDVLHCSIIFPGSQWTLLCKKFYNASVPNFKVKSFLTIQKNNRTILTNIVSFSFQITWTSGSDAAALPR